MGHFFGLCRGKSADAGRSVLTFAIWAVAAGEVALNMPMWDRDFKIIPTIPTADQPFSYSLSALRTLIRTVRFET